MANPLINRRLARQLVLDTFNGALPSGLHEHYRKERVSEDYLNQLEAEFRSLVVRKVTSAPRNGGKTIQ